MFANNVACANETTPIFGFEVTDSPTTGGSVIVGFDFGVGCGPVTNRPPNPLTGTGDGVGCELRGVGRGRRDATRRGLIGLRRG